MTKQIIAIAGGIATVIAAVIALRGCAEEGLTISIEHSSAIQNMSAKIDSLNHQMTELKWMMILHEKGHP